MDGRRRHRCCALFSGLQSRATAAKFDPHGVYVRRWVTELAHVPDKYVHEPWAMSLQIQRQVGCIIGRDYPAPIVEHAAVRERVLTAYKKT